MELSEELDRIASGRYDPILENPALEPVLGPLRSGPRELADLALLLSPGGRQALETMALEARTLTRRRFGHGLQLYAPLYISDHCVNACMYCGFRGDGGRPRRRLEEAELHHQGAWLARAGYRNILLVAGESREHCSVDYLDRALGILTEHVPMAGLEVYPLETEEYARLHRAGAEYLALYQETYDRGTYREVHPRGPKAGFDQRLEAPERACRGGMDSVSLGVLLGLAPWRKDVLSLAAHGRWLELRHPRTRTGFSLPRLRRATGAMPPPFPVSDREYCQALCALRLWMPAAEISLSTRETASLRDGLTPLVVTRLSAGSRTSVGGYGESEVSDPQFEIADDRDLAQVCAAVRRMGLAPLLTDWVPLRGGSVRA